MTIPIFDSSVHPTLSGKWNSNDVDATFTSLSLELDNQANYLGACALGLAGIGDYSHKEYISACQTDNRLLPIAGFNPLKSIDISTELNDICNYGFKGIKIHPRISGIDLASCVRLLIDTLRAAEKNNLVVFLCTYHASNIKTFPEQDPFWELVKILKNAPQTRVILMHGGMDRILQYADLARFNDNILLDLSYTLIKYQKSSVEIDMRYLFNTFDSKICIGSDYPQYSLAELRNAFDSVGKEVEENKLMNIGYKNILEFLNIRQPHR